MILKMKENLVRDFEEKLRKAMVDGDVESLVELIADDLIFVNHFGQILTKEADLEAHRSGLLKFSDIKFLDQRVILLENSAVAITRAMLAGTVGGEPIEDEMCYTRVWRMDKNKLIVISGHCSVVQRH
jgi:ketosteroid isomerase-like protein